MGFTPLASDLPARGFTPLPNTEEPSALAPAVETLKDIARVYPVLETGANLATQAVAIPIAGIAGLGAVASNTMGMTEDADPVDVINKVSGAIAYHPHTQSGQHLTGAATYPFQKLAEAGQYVGGKTLDATGSPALATAADTAINVAPMAFTGKPAEPKGVLARAADRHIEQAQVVPDPVAVEMQPRQAHPGAPIETVQARSAQEAITQPMPITEVSQAPVTPRAQVADPMLLEHGAVERQGSLLKNVETSHELVSKGAVSKEVSKESKVSESTMRPGFTPLEQVAPEVVEPIEAIKPEAAMSVEAPKITVMEGAASSLPPDGPQVVEKILHEGKPAPSEAIAGYPDLAGDKQEARQVIEPPAVIPFSEVKNSTKIEFEGKTFKAKKLLEASNKRVERYQALLESGSLAEGFAKLNSDKAKLFSDKEMKEITVLANRTHFNSLNTGEKLTPRQAEVKAIQEALDFALAERLEISDLIYEEQGGKPAMVSGKVSDGKVSGKVYTEIEPQIEVPPVEIPRLPDKPAAEHKAAALPEIATPGTKGFTPIQDAIPDTAVSREAVSTKAAPIVVEHHDQLKHAEQQVNTSPSEAQKEAGNYAKAHISWNGLDISIENPAGSKRSGIAGGKAWSVTMPASYGYLKRTKGADGDHVDVYIGKHLQSDQVFIVDQKDVKTGKFDEHKVMLGFPTQREAERIYKAGFSDRKGTERMGAVTSMSVAEFKEWLKTEDTTKPVSAAKVNRAMVDSETLPKEAVDSRSAWAPGANYTGFADSALTAGKLADKPIRREDVLIPLMKGLGIRVYEGRVTGKRLGFYIPKVGAVRIKHKSDLEVAAHEIAHALDDRIPTIRDSWLKGDMAKIHAEELRGVSYDKTKIFEGFAEFTRLYMTQPEKAKAAAPNFYRWFDNFTQRHEYGPAIRKAQENMTAWFSQDALARAQSKVGKQRIINEALDGLGDKFRQAVTDDLHGIYRMERQLTGKTNPLGAYETARLTRGAGGLVDGAIRLGSPIRKANGSFDFQGKGLEKILEPVAGNLDEFLMYAVGRSSHELMMQGRERLFTPAEVRSMLQLKRPEFETAFAEYQAWNKGVLDFAESMGVINKKARSMWQRSQYLPFYRVGQPGASASKGGAQGNWAGIQALTGGTGNLRDILGNMTQNAATLIDTALKNEARAKIVRLAQEQKGGGNFLVKIAPDSRLVKIEREQLKEKLLEAAGIDPAAARAGRLNTEQAKLLAQIEQQLDSAPGLFEFLVHNQTPKGNIMAVLEDGKPTYYEVADPLLYRAVASLNRAPQHWIVRLLGMPKRVGQATITLTPDFMVANLARDTIMGAVMSRVGFRPFVDSAKGMASRIKQDPAYREYLANGGGFASYLKDENTFRAHLDRFYTSKGFNPKTVLDTPDKMMYFVETLADAFEMSTRLGEYKRLREHGIHPREAAYLGREVSTDFAMKGDSQVLGAMYDTVMFLRPAVVSMDRLYRGLAHDPNKGAIAAKTGTIALMSAWLYWQNKDNPRYDELADWDKDAYWHFFVPVNGKEEHFRYPKIWEVGALASVAERTVAALNEQEPEYGKAVGRILTNLFNVNLMPQVAAPLFEQARNRNSFTNTPIETPGMENLQPFLRAKPTTSETLKAAGMATHNLPEAMQVNPVRAEALLRGYFNTWAMYGLMLSDQALFSDKLPERRKDELPVVRRFYESDPVKHTKYETMFYDMLGEARRLHGTMRELDQAGRSEIADEIEKAPLSSKAKQLERASRNVSTINADMEEVRRSHLTPAEKRAKLDALTREKNELLKATVREVKDGAR